MIARGYLKDVKAIEHSGQPKTVAIERAVNMYIDRYDDMVSTYEKKEAGKRK